MLAGCSAPSTWYDPTTWWGDEEDTVIVEPVKDSADIEDTYPELSDVPPAPAPKKREDIVDQLRSTDVVERRYIDEKMPSKGDRGMAGNDSSSQIAARPLPPVGRVDEKDDRRAMGKRSRDLGKVARSGQRAGRTVGAKRRARTAVRNRPFDSTIARRHTGPRPKRQLRNNGRAKMSTRAGPRLGSRESGAPIPRRAQTPATTPPTTLATTPATTPATTSAMGSTPWAGIPPAGRSDRSPPPPPDLGGGDYPVISTGGDRYSSSYPPRWDAPFMVVRFAHGAAALSDSERNRIKKRAKTIGAHKGNFLVIGHASSRTSDIDPLRRRLVNFDVSVDRAHHVANLLARLGLILVPSSLKRDRTVIRPPVPGWIGKGKIGALKSSLSRHRLDRIVVCKDSFLMAKSF